MSRRYDQPCPVASALDVVGERWTLLIVRELLTGPKRFSDLRRGLPGIPSNLLAGRLSELEAAGVTRRRDLPPPAARTVYELTEDGQALEPVLRSLSRWGISRIAPEDVDAIEPGVAVRAALLAYGRPGVTGARDRVWEVRLDGRPFTVELRDGRLSYHAGAAPDADLVVTADPAALVRSRRHDPGHPGPPELAYQPDDSALVAEFEAVFALA